MQNPPQSIMSKEQFRQLRMQEKNNIYWTKHKETINEQRKEKIQCECGMVVCKRKMDQHKGNSKHSKKILQYKVECLEILGDAFGSNIAISVFSFLV